MSRWQLPIGFSIALTLGALTLLTGCTEEDPATAMLKAQTQGGNSAAPPPADAGGVSATPAPGATPPAGGPGGPVERGAPAVAGAPPGTADAKAKEAGPKVTIDVKEIKAPYPRYDGKGRYDVTIDVAVAPAPEDGVWKISALDGSGKVVGSREEQLVLLREKPRTLMLSDFYCLSAPKSFKMAIALDKSGKPKKATNVGGGVGEDGNTEGGGAAGGPAGGMQGGGSDRGAGGGDKGGGDAGGGGGDAGGGDAGGGGGDAGGGGGDAGEGK